MNKQKIISKLKNQKGVTGVDIVVSITIITLTIVVVTAIYTNIDLTSKNVGRTAGATRIATNILEEIEKLYYADFKDEISDIEDDYGDSGKEYIEEFSTNADDVKKIIINPKKVSKNVKFFNTKIPKGYTVEMVLENAYGTDTQKKYDMVKKIDITVKYKVGDREENVKLSTAKSMELTEVANEPNISKEAFSFYAGVNINDVKPIKRVGNIYQIVSDNYDGWYSYENKVWAAVVVGTQSYDQATGILKDNFRDYMYVWIPNYGVDNEGKFVFRYKNTNYIIINDILSKAGENKSVYTLTKKTATDKNNCQFKTSGYWIKYQDLKDSNKETYKYINQLNNSEYGPFEP